MLLILSKDLKTWRLNKELLLLGQWCINQETKEILKKVSFKILPYHWHGKRQVIKDAVFLKKLYNQWIVKLGDQLNTLHNLSYSSTYWEIVIGPWLNRFLCSVFDKYQCIKEAVDTPSIEKVLVYQYQPGDFIPNDIEQFITFFHQDAWNTYVFTLLIHFFKTIPYEEIEQFHYDTEQPLQFKQKMKYQLKLTVNRLLYFFSKKKVGLYIYGHKLSIFERIRMQLTCGQGLFVNKETLHASVFKTDLSLRRKLSFSYQNEFERFLAYLLPLQIPKSYIEGFSYYQQVSKNKYPEEAGIVLTSEAGIYYDEAFKVWLAYAKEQGSKLYVEQHGGCYGISQISISEYHELRIADLYYTWGWQHGVNSKKIQPLLSTKLSKGMEKLKSRPKNNGVVLLSCVEQARHAVHVDDRGIIGPNFIEYIENLESLLEQFEVMYNGNFLLKLYPADRGWQMKDRLKKYQRHFLPSNMDFYTALNNSALHISTYNGTTFLETLAANYPTMLFWPENMVSFRCSVVKEFKELEKIGILHRDQESICNKLQEIKGDITAWWCDKKVQECIKVFCQRFALLDSDYFSLWRKELQYRLRASSAS